MSDVLSKNLVAVFVAMDVIKTSVMARGELVTVSTDTKRHIPPWRAGYAAIERLIGLVCDIKHPQPGSALLSDFGNMVNPSVVIDRLVDEFMAHYPVDADRTKAALLEWINERAAAGLAAVQELSP